MPTPSITVQLGLDSALSEPFFRFGSSTDPGANPQSLFDNTTYTLGGTNFRDVTSYVKSISVSRGRSRLLDKFNTGTAKITFKNQDRTFDPLNTSSTLYPDVRPRRDIRITSNGTPIYTGIIDDVNLDYNVSGESIASFACVDGFALLSQRVVTAHTATAQASGARIGAIMDRAEVDWPASLRQLDTGAQTLQADVIDADTDALSYLQLVESSEPGFFFINRGGTAQFEDRNAAAVVSAATFTDVAGSGIPYTSIQIQYGQEDLYNRVQITRAGGTLQRADDLTSQSEYGITTLDQTGLLINTDANALSLANYLLGKYKNPEYRIESISVELAALSAANQAAILARELTDVVTVKFTPNKTGTQIVQYGQIIGIQHDIRPDSHRVTFSLAQTDGRVAFVFDSTQFGVLDSSTLGF